jgi:hypothetical protein
MADRYTMIALKPMGVLAVPKPKVEVANQLSQERPSRPITATIHPNLVKELQNLIWYVIPPSKSTLLIGDHQPSATTFDQRDTQESRETTTGLASKLIDPIAKATYEHSQINSINSKISAAVDGNQSISEGAQKVAEPFESLLKNISLFVTVVENLGKVRCFFPLRPFIMS